MISHVSQSIRTSADIGVYGAVAIGWLGILQPWITALATLLAILWTAVQLYDRCARHKREKKKGKPRV